MQLTFDLETTSTDEKTGLVLECAIQKFHPETLAVEYEATTLVVHEKLPTLDPTVREMHTENHLLGDLKTAPLRADGWVVGHRGLDIWLADQFTHLRAQPASIMLTGMSIQFDRRWVEQHLPFAKAFMHHRMLDLSTVRELLRLWEPLGCPQLPKVDKIPHRSLDDCKLALSTLGWYQRNVFPVNMPSMVERLLLLDEMRRHPELKALMSVLHGIRRGEVKGPSDLAKTLLQFLDATL